MIVELPYSGETITVAVPDANFDRLLQPNEVPEERATEAAVRPALRAPVGSEPLSRLAPAGAKVCIIVDDISRPTPTHLVVPAVLEELHAAGVEPDDILILFGLGSHRAMTKQEMEFKLGADICARFRVDNSEFTDKSRMQYLGEAEPGAEIWLDRRVVEADLRVAVGNIVPHGAVGWSGGGKMIYPGIASADTVANYHMKSGLIPENLLGQHEPSSRIEMERWVEYVGLEFIVNTILTREMRLYKVVAGHYVHAHRAGIIHAERVYAVPFDRRADIAIVSAYPAEADFWQAGKGILSAEKVLVDGGTLILVAPCPEGHGPHPRFAEYVGADDAEDQLAGMIGRVGELDEREDPLALAVAVILVRIRKRVRVVVVSPGLSDEVVREARFTPASTAQEALDGALSHHGPGSRVIAITHGSEVLPKMNEQ